MTNKEFDFDKIGKQMPYTTPDGFFDKLEDDIWTEVKDDFLGQKNDCQEQKDDNLEQKNDKTAAKTKLQERKPAKLRLLMRSVFAVAASIALVLVIHMNFSKPNDASINDVDQAFSQLTTDDQAYLLNIYQDDVFINE